MKNLILVLASAWLALSAFAAIPGTVQVSGTIAPAATNSAYGAQTPRYGYGGLLTGASSLSQLQDLNWYPLARRHPFMIATVTNTGAQYVNDLTLTNWYNTGTVSSMAQLLLIEPGVGGLIQVDSYYGDGLGGGFVAFITNSIVGTNAYGGMVLARGGTNSWIQIIENGSVNALSFGAGTGIFADTARLQAAWNFTTNSLTSGELFLPKATYLIDSPGLQLGCWERTGSTQGNQKISIRGQTVGARVKYPEEIATRLKLANNANCNVITVPQFFSLDMNGIGVDGNRLNQTTTNLVGVLWDGAGGFHESMMKDCIVTSVSGDGIEIKRSEVQLIQVNSLDNLHTGLKGNSSASDLHFDWVLSGYNFGNGIEFNGIGTARGINVDSYGNGGHGMILTNVTATRWEMSQMNDNYRANLIISGSANKNYFAQCHFNNANTETNVFVTTPLPPTGTWPNVLLLGTLGNAGHSFMQCWFYRTESLTPLHLPSYGFDDQRTGTAYPGDAITIMSCDFPTPGNYTTGPYTSGLNQGVGWYRNTIGQGNTRDNIRYGLDVRAQPEGMGGSALVTLRPESSFGPVNSIEGYYYNGTTNAPYRNNYNTANGTRSAPTAIVADQDYYYDAYFGHSGGAGFQLGAAFGVSALQTFTNSPASYGSQMTWYLAKTNSGLVGTGMRLNGVGLNVNGDNSAFGSGGGQTPFHGIRVTPYLGDDTQSMAGMFIGPIFYTANTNYNNQGISLRPSVQGVTNTFGIGINFLDWFSVDSGKLDYYTQILFTEPTQSPGASISGGAIPTDGNRYFIYSTITNQTSIAGPVALTGSLTVAGNEISGTNTGDGVTPQMLAAAAMGSSIKAHTLNCSWLEATSTLALGDAVGRFAPVWIAKPTTITGVGFVLALAGDFTGDAVNSIALYSYSAGVLTKVAETANDPNIWKNTASTYVQVNFTTPYVVSAPGLYFVCGLYNNSSQVTAPILKSGVLMGDTALSTLDLTNSSRFTFHVTASTQSTPINMSATSVNSVLPFYTLY